MPTSFLHEFVFLVKQYDGVCVCVTWRKIIPRGQREPEPPDLGLYDHCTLSAGAWLLSRSRRDVRTKKWSVDGRG